MSPFANPVGITVLDEAGLKHGFNEAAKRMMHHAVAERRGTDLAPLGFVNEEIAIPARSVGLSAQFVLQRKQTVGDLMLKCGYGVGAALALRRESVSQPKIVPTAD